MTRTPDPYGTDPDLAEAGAQPAGAPPGYRPGPDPNLAAVERAALDPAHAKWLQDVAALVDGRLDAVRRDWRSLPDADALRAAVFGLLLGLLSTRYPQSREVLSRVAEAHPSFGTLPTSRRLGTLEQLSGSGELVAQWLGPTIGVDDPARLRPLHAFGGAEQTR